MNNLYLFNLENKFYLIDISGWLIETANKVEHLEEYLISVQ